jgi:formylglycine-generating enzyme required for sulfatase activity
MGLNDAATESLFDLSQFPAHSVTVGNFWIDKTEVTNSEYAEFIAATKYAAPSYWSDGKPPAGQDRFPVTYVSVADAKAFADWRSKRDGMKYRLPTEEEWEYVARNGQEGTLYPWGNDWVDGSANVGAVSLEAVGSRQAGASRQGVLDLIGNAWEWTSTRATPYPGNSRYQVAPGQVIIRGGAYPDKARGPDAITATRRSWLSPTDKQAMIGFRLVRE